MFAYNGTTYAPLRALAEAYGLKVGYDPMLNLATVDNPEKVSVDENNTQFSDSELETAPVEHVRVTLYKVGDQHYAKDQYFSKLDYYKIGNLIFPIQDVKKNGESFTAWELLSVIRHVYTDEFIVKQSDNPFFMYIADRVMKTGYEDCKYCSEISGIEETIWYSPSQSYTPTWLEINGFKLYNLNPYTAETVGRFQIQEGIRYYNGMPCLNDVLKAFGIDKEIIIGEYEGFTYMEIK